MLTLRWIPLIVSCLLAAMMLSTAVEVPNPEDVYRSLAFVFDTTGSMKDDYYQLKSHAEQIMTYVQNRNVTGLKHFVFVPFNDPDVGPVTETFHPDVIMKIIDQVNITGGKDCPEMGITAVIQALNVVKPNSYIYVFTDASAKDSYLVDKALELIQRKQSQVIVLKTGKCEMPDTSYDLIASFGSGYVFDVKKTDLTTVLNFIKTSMDTDRVNLLSVDVPQGQQNRTWKNLYIDDSIRSFLISVSGVDPNIELVNPMGEKIDEKLLTNLNLTNIKIVNILDPEFGKWQLYVTCETAYSIRVVGVSTNNFDIGFATVKQKNMTQTSHRPLKGTDNYILINCPDVQKFVSCNIQALSSGDNKTKSLPIFQFEKNMILCGPFLPYDKPFYVQIFGMNNNRNYFKRITKTSIIPEKPNMPYITMPKKMIAQLGGELIIKCRVESLVPFTVTWTSTLVDNYTNSSYFKQSSVVEFVVHNVTQKHQGTYTCAAQNMAGYVNSTTDVTVISKPTIVEGSDDQTVILYKGEDYMMKCTGFGIPSPKIEWSVSNNSQPNILVHDALKLIIFDAMLSNSNVYTCRATNIYGFTEKHYNVIVKESNTTISQADETLTVDEFNDVYMQCPLQNANDHWLKDGSKVNEIMNRRSDLRHYKINDRSLKIYDIEIADSAEYTCSNSTNTYSFDLKVAFPPYFLKNQLETFMRIRNEMALFDCSFNGYPTPKVIWRKKEYLLPITQWTLKGVEFLEDKQILKIHSIDWIHNGTYSCYVENKLGYERRNFELLVF